MNSLFFVGKFPHCCNMYSNHIIVLVTSYFIEAFQFLIEFGTFFSFDQKNVFFIEEIVSTELIIEYV